MNWQEKDIEVFYADPIAFKWQTLSLNYTVKT